MAAVGFSELGVTGLQTMSGTVQEEFLRELQGDKWNAAIREMSSQDAVIGAILLAVEMLMRQAEWSVEPADDSPAAQELATFVGECLGDMSLSWEDTLAEILTMLPWGWAYLELVYKQRGGDVDNPTKRSRYSDGRIGWRKWAIRSQTSREGWEFDEAGGVRGMWQTQAEGSPILIPIEKALLFRTSAHKSNPEGRSILRHAYRAWYFKKNIENIEGIGIERDLAGLPVAHVPPEVLAAKDPDNAALLAQVQAIVTNIRRDEQEGVVWPLAYDEDGHEMFRLELLTSGGSRQFDTDRIIGRYNQQIAMSVLADFIMLGHEQVGSYALSATKASFFKTALRAWLASIADVINTHAIPRLLRLNGHAVELAPKLTFGRVGDVELGDLMAFVETVTGAGMQLFPDVETENRLRGEVGLPQLSEEEIARREQEAEQQRAQPAPEQSEPDEAMARYSPAELAALFEAAQRAVMGG